MGEREAGRVETDPLVAMSICSMISCLFAIAYGSVREEARGRVGSLGGV